MTVAEIIKEYLEAHGFDGLGGDDCCCELSDLFPCNGIGLNNDISSCCPSYKIPCDPETCVLDGDCDFHMSGKKPEPTKEKSDGKEEETAY